MLEFISGMLLTSEPVADFEVDQLTTSFKTESDYIKSQRAAVISDMKNNRVLLLDGYRPTSIRGASVLSDWKAQREQRGIANAVEYVAKMKQDNVKN